MKKILIVLGVVALIGIGKYVYDVNIDHNFEPISEGKVYKSGTIPPDELPEYIKKYKIKSVVDLRRPGTGDLVNNPEVNPELVAEKAAVESVPGAKYFDVGSEQIPDQATLDKFYAVMDNPDNYPVLVHCYHGEGRAPLFGAIYKMEYEKIPNEQAREEARWFVGLSPFAASKKKGQFVLNYKTREQKAAEKNK
ncbi:dual specificity protein phosphatase family protein [Flavobacterium cerinum]|nr:dual specificity protein phosphatase family protein [Flavobacterium cerinum]